MSIIQIILLGFLVFTATRTFLRFRAKDIQWNEFLFWIALWVGIGVVVVIPNLTSRLATFVGVGRGADLAVYTAIALILYLLFRLMVMHDRLDQDISKVVSTIALKDLEQKAKNEK